MTWCVCVVLIVGIVVIIMQQFSSIAYRETSEYVRGTRCVGYSSVDGGNTCWKEREWSDRYCAGVGQFQWDRLDRLDCGWGLQSVSQ